MPEPAKTAPKVKHDIRYQLKRWAVIQGLAESIDQVPGYDTAEVMDFINTKLEAKKQLP